MATNHSYTSEDEAHAATQLATLRGSGDVAPLTFGSAAAASRPAPATSAATASATAAPPTSSSPYSIEAGPSQSKQFKAEKTDKLPRKNSTASSPSKPRPDKTADDAADAKHCKKRRRVVVACDTCRRKKVKCEGLPNPTNTCINCNAYNYRCTFSSEPDRSRGKYEILESKVETLLSALRSVAPHIAEQFERGELTITGPSGGSAPPQNATGWRSLHSAPDGEYDELNGGGAGGGNDADATGSDRAERGNDGQGRGGRQGSEHPGSLSGEDAAAASAAAAAAARKENDRDALIPDVEEGRPRYFGHSSTFSLFHSLPAGKHSRPPSPGSALPRPRHPGTRPQIFDSYEASTARARTSDEAGGGAGGSGDGKSVRFSKEAPRPLHPTNSKEWIQLLRRKNTVAVGRDDLNTEEWLTRYTLPAADLVADLLKLYFERLHPLMPIVHRPSLERDIATGRADKDVAFRGMVFTLLTIASRHSNDPRVYADPNDPDTAGDHFAAASRLYHQVYAASLTNVQVMILTATFMHGAIGPGASWTVLGVAIRALHDIGLHQERAYRGFTPFDQEIRRRAFWGAMILDGIFSINMGRPPGLRLEDCDVRMPLDIDDDTLAQFEDGGPIVVTQPPEGPTITSGFIHMIKLNILAKDIVSILYTQRWRGEAGRKPPHNVTRHAPDYKDMAQLSKRLDQWVADTPEHLRTLDSPYKLQAGLVQCGTHDIRLYILKPFLDHAALKKILHPQCSHHARECLKVVLELYEGGHVTDLVFIFQQALMSTATFMITVWHECRDVDRLAEDNDLIEATLRTFGSFDDRFFSKIFRRAHRILRNVATRTIHTMNSDQRERSPARGSTDYGTPAGGSINGLGGYGPMDGGGDAAMSSSSINDGHGGMAAMQPQSAPSWTTNSATATSGASNGHSHGHGHVGVGGGVDGNGGAGLHPVPYADSRGILPLFTPAPEDVRSTTHQLEDLTWTDYFSKFLDDIGDVSQADGAIPPAVAAVGSGQHAAGMMPELPFGLATPGSSVSVAGGGGGGGGTGTGTGGGVGGGTPRRYAM
ncbi:uncharacterized protein PFL1_05893 [Pseudozyma flocculosa PF-1]|uniref:Zn(2)-C6 fungal-type domain-containing protein n=1 Tax=Pseudozyma flocculosa PF-1 TaxID=1277687 RepID=A0A061H1Q7_9BASI|nr:uncharacterized protein PFL1_05893 [Pseudozyma flocculosa PF-1]EPQ26572.1 hypothetical protein PFL1_05893 [Pseudozyma flocculosa PF-1]